MNPDGSVKSTTITTEPVVLDGSGKGYYAVQKVLGRENVPDTLNSKWRITKEPDTYHIIKKDGVDMIDVKEWKEGTIDIGAYEYETVSLTPFGGNILYVKSSEAVSDKENNGETWERATSNIHQAIQVLLLSPNKKINISRLLRATMCRSCKTGQAVIRSFWRNPMWEIWNTRPRV